MLPAFFVPTAVCSHTAKDWHREDESNEAISHLSVSHKSTLVFSLIVGISTVCNGKQAP